MCPIYHGEAKHSQTFDGVKGWGYMTITTTAKFSANEIASKLIAATFATLYVFP